MKFKPYPKYKPSGMEWLDEIPVDWVVVTLRWVTERYSGGTPDKSNLDYWTDGTIPWLNSGAVNQQYIIEPSAFITEAAFQGSSAKWVPKDALVMALAGQGKTKGMVAQMGIASTCNQSMAALVPGPRLDPRFLYWWLTSNYQNIRNMAGGDLRDGLNLDLLASIQTPLMDINDQIAIAVFLDRETAKIDTLIAKQEKLIELLKEKRQAVISQVVTKGLDLTVPMKPSGVEWLGDVPEHWTKSAIKHFTLTITDGAHVSPETENGEYYFVSTKDVRDDEIDFSGSLLTSASSYDYLVKTGCRPQLDDVLFSKDGSIGKTVVVRTDREFVVASSLIIIRPDQSALDSEFLNYACQGYCVKAQVESFVKGAGLPRLSIQNLLKVWSVFPPLEEQKQIVCWLNNEVMKIKTLITKAEQAIALQKEHRIALISAAVTGKIDVREAVSELQEAA